MVFDFLHQLFEIFLRNIVHSWWSKVSVAIERNSNGYFWFKMTLMNLRYGYEFWPIYISRHVLSCLWQVLTVYLSGSVLSNSFDSFYCTFVPPLSHLCHIFSAFVPPVSPLSHLSRLCLICPTFFVPVLPLSHLFHHCTICPAFMSFVSFVPKILRQLGRLTKSQFLAIKWNTRQFYAPASHVTIFRVFLLCSTQKYCPSLCSLVICWVILTGNVVDLNFSIFTCIQDCKFLDIEVSCHLLSECSATCPIDSFFVVIIYCCMCHHIGVLQFVQEVSDIRDQFGSLINCLDLHFTGGMTWSFFAWNSPCSRAILLCDQYSLQRFNFFCCHRSCFLVFW